MASELYIGLMSGTSVDGIDAVVADFATSACRLLGATHAAFTPELCAALHALQSSGGDEIHRAALAANDLMDCAAGAVADVLRRCAVKAKDVKAIGLHGQTIRHRPELGYTTQIANPARLAELTGITIVADFRSRDIAAGGQGAPLVPAFHAAVFRDVREHRVMLNLGGIANITDLPSAGPVQGFDTGPGNTLLDAWCRRHTGATLDRGGAWAAQGRVIEPLLEALKGDPYFATRPPKSTGRDYFHLPWVERHLEAAYRPVDVQRTLVALTADTISAAIAAYCRDARCVLACGGGTHNDLLMDELAPRLAPRRLTTTAEYGVPVSDVEALAFAWLARECVSGRPGNLPEATGARGPRILGAIYAP